MNQEAIQEIIIGSIITLYILISILVFSLITKPKKKEQDHEYETEANAMEVNHTFTDPPCCHGSISTGCCHKPPTLPVKRPKHKSEQ